MDGVGGAARASRHLSGQNVERTNASDIQDPCALPFRRKAKPKGMKANGTTLPRPNHRGRKLLQAHTDPTEREAHMIKESHIVGSTA